LNVLRKGALLPKIGSWTGSVGERGKRGAIMSDIPKRNMKEGR
jgi:hypothetical protein